MIPRTCVLQISNRKLDDIYYELRSINVENYKNAVAVLFRVFIELSMDCFIEKNKLVKVDLNDSLREKVVEVANYLEIKNLASKHICKGVRHAVNDRNGILGVDTWNAYVHNPRFSPTPVTGHPL